MRSWLAQMIDYPCGDGVESFSRCSPVWCASNWRGMTLSREAERTLTVKSVFIASPSDLNDEREVFRQVVQEINAIKANSIGLHLEPLGWEDTLPGRGRPQGLINEDVGRSDLFVLLLWKRWGSATGLYSSGVEEEFELAKRLNESQGGRPEMWIYFKDVPDDMLSDPGPQLQKVLEFRRIIEAERSFLYGTFETPDQWERGFRLELSRWLDPLRPSISTTEAQEGIDQLRSNLVAVTLQKDHAVFKLGELIAPGRLVEGDKVFELVLEPGWNLISVPCDPLNRALESVFGHEVPVNTIVSYDPETPGGFLAAVREPSGEWVGTLNSVDGVRGYWVLADRSVTARISITSQRVESIALRKGWNLIGYGSAHTSLAMYARDYLASIQDRWTSLAEYDPVPNEWREANPQGRLIPRSPPSGPPAIDVRDPLPLEFVQAGRGYWLFADYDSRLEPP